MNEISLDSVMEMMVRKANGLLAELNEYCANARQVSRNLLLRIVRDNERTEYGQKYGFADIHSVEDYKAKVPLSSYDDYAAAIERMVRGEKKLLTVYPIGHYAVTSGSVDNPKNIPVSLETIDIYEKYAAQIAMTIGYNYIEKTQHRKMKAGKRLLTAVVKDDHVADGTTRGAVSGTVYTKLKEILPLVSATPIQVVFPSGPMNFKYLRALYGLKDAALAAMDSPFMTALVAPSRYAELQCILFM